MSLTPPKFVKMLRSRDQDDLVSRLRALADGWDEEADRYRIEFPPSADESSVRAHVKARVLESVAVEVRGILDD